MVNDNLTGHVPDVWTNALGMKFRLVKAGEFKMGSPRGEARRFADESLHSATLTKDYYLSVFLTTQAEWRAVTGNNPSRFSDYKKAPVESVSWFDCQSFIEKLNEDEYGGELKKFFGDAWIYSLPTEAQWEYACRAGTTSPFFFGSSSTGKEGNFGRNAGDLSKQGSKTNGLSAQSRGTFDVGSFPPNAWGFYDMSGNVCEWTLDGYADYETDAVSDPLGVSVTAEKVARGGSWRSLPENCRSASRFNFLPTYRGDNCGLRVAIVQK